jgi:hypothetical protein
VAAIPVFCDANADRECLWLILAREIHQKLKQALQTCKDPKTLVSSEQG